MRSSLLFLVLAGCAADVSGPEPIPEQKDATPDAPVATDAGPPPTQQDAQADVQKATQPPLAGTLGVGTTVEATDDAPLRSGPSSSDTQDATIPTGSVASVVFTGAPKNGFYEVWFEGKVGWCSGAYLAIAKAPTSKTLSTTVVSAIIEPLGSGTDSAGHSYSDKNYWNFCAPGAATAALSTWSDDATTWPAGKFQEPYGPYQISTYWDDAHSRAYLMHIAEQVSPPSFSAAGLPSFSTYPTTGSSLGDIRDVLNWEASNHASAWSSFFYEKVSASVSSATLHSDVARDITGNHAVVVTVDTAYLPNWSRGLGHAIAIVGYDDSAGTYAYVDTCGKACNGSSQATNGGVWHVAQSKMHSAIAAFGSGYAR